MKREDTEMISKITLNMINKYTLMLAQALNMICGALMLIYGRIRAQRQSHGRATLTITGKAISAETRLLAVTALNSIMSGLQCEKVVLVHFLPPSAVFEHNLTHFSSEQQKKNTIQANNTIVHPLKTWVTMRGCHSKDIFLLVNKPVTKLVLPFTCDSHQSIH